MSALSHLRVGARATAPRSISLRIGAARLVGVAGLVAYNWWIVVPLRPGWMTSVDGFFSDMSADGQPHAAWMQRLDLTAGVLLVLALLLRGPIGADGSRRREWRWVVAFAAFGGIGGAFPYACASGLDAGCRTLERGLELPWHHYVHMAAGISEFACITLAIWLGYRRTRDDDSTEAHLFRSLVWVLVVAYPLLGVAYLGDRWGTIVEPVFFAAFSATLLAELFERAGAQPRWSRVG